jgi:hypothetical protein
MEWVWEKEENQFQKNESKEIEWVGYYIIKKKGGEGLVGDQKKKI